MIKRTLSLLLCASVLLCAPTALAAKKRKKTEPVPEPPKVVAAYQSISGTIKEVGKAGKTVEITLANGQGSFILQLGAESCILNATSRTALPTKDLFVGKKVIAWHSSAVAASNPPQAACLAMVANIETETNLPQYMEIERVYRSGDTYTLQSQPQDVMLSVSQSSVSIAAFKQGDPNKVSAFKPGAGLLYWPSSTEEGTPAKVKTSNIIMLPYRYAGYILMDRTYLNVNGHMLEGKAIVEEDGTVYLPAEEACKRLGFATKYIKSQKLLRGPGAQETFEFVADRPSFTLGKRTIDIPAPKIVNYVFYIPLQAVQALGNYKYVVNA